MPKFKVSDRVRLNSDIGTIPRGEYKIISIDRNGYTGIDNGQTFGQYLLTPSQSKKLIKSEGVRS